MNEELILEVGKTYVFKDDECREKYINNHACNKAIVDRYYKDGFKLDSVEAGVGYHNECIVVIDSSTNEHRLFKLKEPSTQSDNPVETPVITTEDDLPIVEHNHIATALHKLSDSYTLFYSYYPDEKFFLVDYKELSYKVTSTEDVAKLEQMIIIDEELIYVE